MKEAVPAQRFQWSVLAVITEGITLKLEKKRKKPKQNKLVFIFYSFTQKENECNKYPNSQTVLVS